MCWSIIILIFKHCVFTRLQEDARATVQEVSELNQKRKLTHEGAGKELDAIEAEWKALILKNREIETACSLADSRIAELEEQLRQ